MSHKYPASSSVESHCLHSWEVPLLEKDKLDVYFLLKWPTHRFLEQENHALITYNDITYAVQYYRCLPSIMQSYRRMLLSFRRITGHDRGYVLIRPELGTAITQE